MKALYDYHNQHDDELFFCKHAIITNVTKGDSGWWRGDYGGKQQHWFPANYTQEIDPNEAHEIDSVCALTPTMCCFFWEFFFLPNFASLLVAKFPSLSRLISMQRIFTMNSTV